MQCFIQDLFCWGGGVVYGVGVDPNIFSVAEGFIQRLIS